MANSIDQRGIVPAFPASPRQDGNPPAVARRPAPLAIPFRADDDRDGATGADLPRSSGMRRALERFVDVDLLFMILVVGIPFLAYCILVG
ncbi:hypothetical protein [Sphingomonas phyllosphaerae]|uniref:hypothetical protein n=1 Tax=Sphingomonas phyllosphaerae TaxID=257003 RepID=UPI0003B54B0F|nr:hypothetical protein [Sphingomonas phyllosphaerae]